MQKHTQPQKAKFEGRIQKKLGNALKKEGFNPTLPGKNLTQ